MKCFLQVLYIQFLTSSNIATCLPRDMSKVKEQLASADPGATRDRLVDPRTLLPLEEELPVWRLQPGSRRVFLCRMKCKQVRAGARGTALQCGDQAAAVKQEPDPELAAVSSSSGAAGRRRPPSSERKYVTVQVTGYLQLWPLARLGADPALSCLVAVARPLPSYPQPLQVTWPWPWPGL